MSSPMETRRALWRRAVARVEASPVAGAGDYHSILGGLRCRRAREPSPIAPPLWRSDQNVFLIARSARCSIRSDRSRGFAVPATPPQPPNTRCLSGGWAGGRTGTISKNLLQGSLFPDQMSSRGDENKVAAPASVRCRRRRASCRSWKSERIEFWGTGGQRNWR